MTNTEIKQESTPDWVLIRHPGTRAEHWKKVGQGWAHITATMGNGSTMGVNSSMGNGSRMGVNSSMGNGSSMRANSIMGGYSRMGNGSMMRANSIMGVNSSMGNGSRMGVNSIMGVNSSMGNGSRMGANFSFQESPLQIQGSKHLAYHAGRGLIGIGWQVHPIKIWLRDFEKIGKKNSYSSDLIAEYKEYIDMIARRDASIDWVGADAWAKSLRESFNMKASD